MTRTWPTREEWAANAEHAVRTACYPWERVPEGAEHYLTADELAEMDRLHLALSAAVRPHLTREITRLIATIPEPIPAKPLDRADWYDTLTADQQRAWQMVTNLRSARLDIGRRAKGLRSPLHHSVLTPYVRPLVPDQDALARLADLEAKYTRLRNQAAEDALNEAIRQAVERRNTDEGWAKELERRARIDGTFVTPHTRQEP